MDDEVLPAELCAGDVIELGDAAEWRVMSKPRMRPRARSIEIMLQHVRHRGETLLAFRPASPREAHR